MANESMVPLLPCASIDEIAKFGPVVKASGFGTLLWAMALIAACTVAVVVWLPAEPKAEV